MKDKFTGNRPLKKGRSRIRWIAGALLFFLGITFITGIFHGRYNFRYETVEIEYDNLPDALHGLSIVHISDLHLVSFRNHPEKLIQVFDSINSYAPDIIVNTGDFVSIIYHELEPFRDILASLQAEYGVYAIPGNHDTGLYSKLYDAGNFNEHLDTLGKILEFSQHNYLADTGAVIYIDTLSVSIAGVVSYGRIPDIYYGNTDSALARSDNADFSILLSHDPNHWLDEIQYRDDVDLTLSGHTHGGQVGIMLPGLQLSPASLLYPAWSGLYGERNNYLYVNRGLGIVGFPARIGMPPEITIIRLLSSSHPVTP
ncbi:MAG: metallophosphoesterase [Bacteroidales bacterium]|nr:metallophosphoesterase [Bacteroidales bacterium]